MRLDHLLSKELWQFSHLVRGVSRPMPRPYVSGVVLTGGTSTMVAPVGAAGSTSWVLRGLRRETGGGGGCGLARCWVLRDPASPGGGCGFSWGRLTWSCGWGRGGWLRGVCGPDEPVLILSGVGARRRGAHGPLVA